ncbi:RNA polymerase sigma factor [Alkalicoccobacillus murimartini]|uniref:RNA polymerase sigma-70 factor (ECF subfamily) n=1 Tax=Alkalicoccobacillus murimartini TaxID=171685 RepID=A0ABT9YI14_9BACI|nr:sigma-70 family RNA polymerase sigma factor [Alkalicoccobacillus murimartini]MDQ0207503.1 RNA polymerase sigma-70 factor (ECF subfamily) [Alkalicoccobacillus murimartini]
MNQTFNQEWKRYASSTWRACVRFTNNHHDAEDLMQTTWVKAYSSWHRNPKLLTKTYFTTIAKHTWIDEVRKKKLNTVPYEDNCKPFENSIDRMTSLHFRHVLNTLVTKLTINQQILFLLSDVCRCSLKEIAALTNMSVGAVKATLFRARQKIIHDVREDIEGVHSVDEDEALRVKLYSEALQKGDIQLIASLLTDNASIPALYVQQQKIYSTLDCKMVA